MFFRVRLDLAFENKDDANLLMAYAKKISSKATSINEGKDNEEIGFIDLHICRHDEGRECEKLERLEVR